MTLIDGFEGQGSADLIAAFAEPIPVIVIAELLGVPGGETARLLDWSHRMVAMYTPRRDRAVEDAAVAATEDFVAFLRGYRRRAPKVPRDDLITHLIAAEAAATGSREDELIAGVIQLLNAGHEATVHAIGNAVKAILESGESPAALFASDESIAATVEELLRFDPPLHFFDRYALEDVEFAGIRFRKGEKIGLLLAAANRDPARWTDATSLRSVAARCSRMSPSARASTSASARRWRGSSFRWRCRSCSGACRAPIAAPPLYRHWHFHGLDSLNVEW